MRKLLLALDGGGALGCGPALFLSQLEKVLKFKEAALAGTSVGGLLVLLRAIGMSWDGIRQLFDLDVGKIFHDVPWYWRTLPPLVRPKWQSDGIEQIVHDVFGDKKCKDVVTPFFVTSTDFKNGKFKVWDETDDEYLRNVALYTTAAPTYFVPRNDQGKPGGQYADGGLIANNPSSVGIAGMIAKMGIPLSDVVCLSLATGGAYWKDPSIGAGTTKVGWIEPIINMALQGNDVSPDFVSQAVLSAIPDSYLRLGPTDPREFNMDDLSSLTQFRQLWQNLWDANSDLVPKFIAPTQGPASAGA